MHNKSKDTDKPHLKQSVFLEKGKVRPKLIHPFAFLYRQATTKRKNINLNVNNGISTLKDVVSILVYHLKPSQENFMQKALEVSSGIRLKSANLLQKGYHES